MAWDINRVVLVGRLANEIELKGNGDKSIAKFGLAVGGRPNPDGTDNVSFFDIVTFGKTADNCASFLKKGTQVAVEGRLQQSRWQAQDGGRRSKVEVIADRVEFLGGSVNSGQSPNEMPDNSEEDFAPF